MIVHDVVKSSCEPDAVDIECPLPSVRQSADAADSVTDDTIHSLLKQNIEQRISLYGYHISTCCIVSGFDLQLIRSSGKIL